MIPYEIEGLRFEYPGRFALEIDALRIEEREKLAVVGRNGSGKTTLLRVLSFLQRPGRCRVFRHWGVDVDPSRPWRSELGVLRQQPWIFRGTVAENLAYPLQVRGIPARAIRGRVDAMSGRLGLLERIDAPARSLSGGEQRRLALGRVLIGEPRVLLLDEPTAHLDGRSLAVVERLLVECDATLLVTTHDASFALSVARRILVLDGGRIAGASAAPGAPDAALPDPGAHPAEAGPPGPREGRR